MITKTNVEAEHEGKMKFQKKMNHQNKLFIYSYALPLWIF